MDRIGSPGAALKVRSAALERWTSDEIMTIVGSRSIRDGSSCFVGIGIPSTVVNLARATHAPNVTLVYESGPIGAKPQVLPLSIGDGELSATADTVVSIPEMFNYWLQGGNIDMGYLSAAQIDRLANLNSTVIGSRYADPTVRLPGAGGAPNVAAFCKAVTVIMRHQSRAFVRAVDFVTSVGFGPTDGYRESLGLTGRGPTTVITDLGILEPDPHHRELTLVAVHPGVTVDMVRDRTQWELRVADDIGETSPPTETELEAVRSLVHAGSAS